MERTINKPNFITILTRMFIVILLALMPAKALSEDNMNALITPQNVDFKICTRTYILQPDKLFYMAIASANANKFKIEEIQSKTGYILFTAAGKQYLATIVKVDSKRTLLKITPTNNNYFFAPGIVTNFFRYIDLNGATPTVSLPRV